MAWMGDIERERFKAAVMLCVRGSGAGCLQLVACAFRECDLVSCITLSSAPSFDVTANTTVMGTG